MGSKNTAWIAGTVVLSLLLTVAAWFVVLSPIAAQTATTAADSDAAELRNGDLSDQLDVLKEQSLHLTDYKDELAGLQQQLPVGADLAAMTRQIDQIAAETGVTVMHIAVASPAQVLPAVDTAAAPPVDGTADPAATPEATASAPAEPTPVATTPSSGKPIAGFVAIGLDISVLGHSEQVLSFLERLQSGAPRLYLVTGFTALVATAPGDASAGRPATEEGDLDVTISGFAYTMVLTALDSGPSATEPDPLADGALPQ